MIDSMQNRTVELSVPAHRDMMLVLRLTTAGVVARAGLGVDRINDVKMAVEEACALIIETARADMLRLTFATDADALTICICGGACEYECTDEDEMQVVRCILESLVDDVQFCRTESGAGSGRLRVALGK